MLPFQLVFSLKEGMIFLSCYRPLLGQRYLDMSTGAFSVRVSGRFDRDHVDRDQLQDDLLGLIKIPCGKCIGCRLDYSRAWADRCMIELDHSKTAIFVTLTYDDLNLKFNCQLYPTLYKKDCQDFLKRLRYHFSDKEIRFYLSGEYGPTTMRPHYHAILFGLDLGDFHDLEVVGKNKLGELYYSSKKFQSIWSHGFVQMSNVSWRTCAYCARYVAKKVSDILKYINLTGVQAPFSLMSRRPGLAGFYLEDHPDVDMESKVYLDDIYTHKPVRSVNLPGYIFDRLAAADPDRADQLIKDRQLFSDDRLLIELSNSDLDYISYLSAKEQKKESEVKALVRSSL